MAETTARFTPGTGSGTTDSSTAKTTTDTETEKKESVDLAALVAEIKDLKERVEGQSRRRKTRRMQLSQNALRRLRTISW
jgi:hypothetical protein